MSRIHRKCIISIATGKCIYCGARELQKKRKIESISSKSKQQKLSTVTTIFNSDEKIPTFIESTLKDYGYPTTQQQLLIMIDFFHENGGSRWQNNGRSNPNPPYCPGCKDVVPDFGDICQTCRNKFNTCTCIEDKTTEKCKSEIHDCCCIQVSPYDCMAKKDHSCLCNNKDSDLCRIKKHK